MRKAMGVSVLALAVAVGWAAPAAARAGHGAGHKAGRGAASPLEAAEAEIRRQHDEIEALKALVAQQGAAIAALQHPAPASPAPYAPAAAQLAQNAPAAPAVPPVPAPAPAPAPASLAAAGPGNTQFRVTSFFNESTIHQTANGQVVPAEGTGFNIKRLYFGADHQFNRVFSASVLADVRNVVGSSSNSNNATNSSSSTTPVGRAFYVKNAYLQVALDPAFTLRLGAAPSPWLPYLESLYGYRHIENALVDRVRLGNTADWGVHVLGQLAGGAVAYQVSAVDGSGFSDVNVTKYVDVEARLSAQYAGFFAAVGGYTGHLGKSVSSSTGGFAPVYHTARRGDLAAGYKNERFTLGGEYYYARDYNSVNSLTEDSSQGYSLFGNVSLAPKWSVFGRYDWVRNIANLSAPVRVTDHYFNTGLQWEPVRIVDMALVYKREVASNGAILTQNGTIGTALGRGTYDELGLFGQFKF